MDDLVHSFPPQFEFLGCLGCGHSHEVVAQLLVSFVPPLLLLAIDVVGLGGIDLLTSGDLLLALLDLSNQLVLVVYKFALESQI